MRSRWAGSHAAGRLYPSRSLAGAGGANRMPDQLPNHGDEPADWTILRWPLAPGDAVAFDPCVIHDNAGNRGRSRARRFVARLAAEDAAYCAAGLTCATLIPGHGLADGERLHGGCSRCSGAATLHRTWCDVTADDAVTVVTVVHGRYHAFSAGWIAHLRAAGCRAAIHVIVLDARELAFNDPAVTVERIGLPDPAWGAADYVRLRRIRELCRSGRTCLQIDIDTFFNVDPTVYTGLPESVRDFARHALPGGGGASMGLLAVHRVLHCQTGGTAAARRVARTAGEPSRSRSGGSKLASAADRRGLAACGLAVGDRCIRGLCGGPNRRSARPRGHPRLEIRSFGGVHNVMVLGRHLTTSEALR